MSGDRYFAQEAPDTCALASVRMLIYQHTGRDVPEQELLRQANEMGAFVPGRGTYVTAIPELLRRNGVDSAQLLEDESVANLAQRINPSNPAISFCGPPALPMKEHSMGNERVRRAAAAELGCSEDLSLVGEITARLPWLTRHGAFTTLRRDSREEGLVVTALGRASLVRKGEAPAALNGALRDEGVVLPREVTPEDLADAVLIFMDSPRSAVAGPKLLAGFGGASAWIRDAQVAGEDVLRRLCVEPKVTSLGEKWRLSFCALDARGGVRDWDVRGDSRQITSAVSRPELADGTFRYPFG